LWDAEGLVKEFGDGGLFSRAVIADFVSVVITARSAAGGVFKPAE